MGHMIPLQQSGAADARLDTPVRTVRASAKIPRTAVSLRSMPRYANAFAEADAMPVKRVRGFGSCLALEKIRTDPLPNRMAIVANLTTKA